MSTFDSLTLHNSETRAEINSCLKKELSSLVSHPIVGIQKIRKVLITYGISIPALLGVDYEGDEFIIELSQYGDMEISEDNLELNDDKFYLYVLYYIDESGNYDFFSEIFDRKGLEDIIKEDENIEEDV